MMESALLHLLSDAGGPVAAACLRWLVDGERPPCGGRIEVVWPAESMRL
jgi:hypothetical protein